MDSEKESEREKMKNEQINRKNELFMLERRVYAVVKCVSYTKCLDYHAALAEAEEEMAV